MGRKRLGQVIAGVLVGSIFFSQAVFAEAATSLEQKVAELEQQLNILKRQIEVDKEVTATKTKDAPIITANAKDGFSIKSPDDSFKLKLNGYVQSDARFFGNVQKTSPYPQDDFLVRRATTIFDGTLGNASFRIAPEYGGSSVVLNDAYIDYKFAPELSLRGGKFKVPLSLERLQSSTATNFSELGLAANLTPSRDAGYQVFGALFNGTTTYSLGAFTGAKDSGTNNNDTNNDKDVVARLFVEPFKNSGPDFLKGFGAGIAGSFGETDAAAAAGGANLQTYKSIGQSNIFSYASTVSADGDVTRIVPQFYFYNGVLGLQGEYASSEQDVIKSGVQETFENTGWQLSGNYVLSGELASYKGVVPRKDFDLKKGTWGAWELVGRFSTLDIDNDIFDKGFASASASAVSQADNAGVGLNWYWSRNVKLSLNYDRTEFESNRSNTERKNEDLIISRFQLIY